MLNYLNVEELYSFVDGLMSQEEASEEDRKLLTKLMLHLDEQGMPDETKLFELSTVLMRWLHDRRGTVIVIKNNTQVFGPFGSLNLARKWSNERMKLSKDKYRVTIMELP